MGQRRTREGDVVSVCCVSGGLRHMFKACLRELTVVYGRFDYGRRGYVGSFGLLDVTVIEFQLVVVGALLPRVLQGFALCILLEASTLLI